MPPVAHSYRLGKNQTFSYASAIANKDVKSVTITHETSAEGEVTTRGSDDIQEFVPIRRNMSFEVVVLDHSCVMHTTGAVTIAPATGTTGTTVTGVYYVNNIGEPQEIDGVIEVTISLRKAPG
jgi:hypothetical protein